MFNEEENIEHTIRSLQSIAEEIADSYEIIVVDDGSTDNSLNIITEIAQKDDNVKCFGLEENTKFGGAFSKCFSMAEKCDQFKLLVPSDKSRGEKTFVFFGSRKMTLDSLHFFE